MRVFVVVMFFFAAHCPSAAQSNEACSAIRNDAERLACFDSEQAGTPLPATRSEPAWKLRETVSDLDRSKVVMAWVPAIRTVVRSNSEKTAVLAIRCKERKTDVFVAFQDTIAIGNSDVPVSYRIGDRAPVSAKWVPTQSGKGISPSRDTLSMIRSMTGSADFFVRAETQYFGTSEATFDLNGIEDALKPVRAACRW